MTDHVVLFLVIGFVLVTLLAVLGPLAAHRNYGRVLSALLAQTKTVQGEFFACVQQLFEKVTNDPKVAMDLHLQERMHKEKLSSKVYGDTLVTEKPQAPRATPPPRPPGWHSGGMVETDDLEAARR
jgi:hypothetical protein